MDFKKGYFRTLFVYIFLILSGISCDKIEPPFEEKNNSADTITCPVPQFSAVVKAAKNVLLEEFTGFRCGNCPAGHRILDSLSEVYKDKLISYSIHAGFFSVPIPGSVFTYDFRTSVGNEIDGKFKATKVGTPNAIVSRSSHDGTLILEPGRWNDAIAGNLQKPAEAAADIITIYDEASGKVCVHSRITALEEISRQLNLTLYVVEDSVYQWQEDYNREPQEIENYVHRNVLRGAITGTWGVALNNSVFHKDNSIIKSFVYYPSESWNKSRIYIIGFVTDIETGEVIQAAKSKILP